MFFPSSHPWAEGQTLGEHLLERGVSRRDFLKFCGEMTALLGLSSALTPQVVEALQGVRRPSAIWLSLQECTGCTESVLRSGRPHHRRPGPRPVSLDFQENLMAAAGTAPQRTPSTPPCRTTTATTSSW